MRPWLTCVVAFGVWLSVSSPHAQAQQGQAIAGAGGIAIGGSVSYSNVYIGVPPEKVDELIREGKRPLEELTAQQRENIDLLKEKLNLNERQVRRALEILGEANVPPERLTDKLVEIAERYKALQTSSAAQPGDSTNVIALKAEAQKAIQDGDLDKADALFARVETEQLDSSAETIASRGQIALTRLRYADAAAHFARAAALFPPGSTQEDKRIGYLKKEADALYQQGDEFGDNAALLSAIDRYQRLLALMPRERVPLDWAAAQNNLGSALWALGMRENGTARLEEAVAAFREALSERTRERVPVLWADTQNNLANVLGALGIRESGTTKLEEAVAAYRQALSETTRERAPLDWARSQTNLGIVLAALGVRENGIVRLEEAVAAYRSALEELTRERAPLEDGARGHPRRDRLARERQRTPGGGGGRLSRSAKGTDARARAAEMGGDPDPARGRAHHARPARERQRAPGGGGCRLSRSAEGIYP